MTFRFTPSCARARGLVTLAAFALLLAGAAQAQFTILEEGFEAYTGAVASLGDETDADPVGQWLTVSDDDPLGAAAGSGVQLVNWQAHTGSQAVLLRSSSELILQLPQSRSGAAYQLDFWTQVQKGAGDRNFYVIVRAEGSDTNGQDFLAYRSDRAATPSIFWWDGIEPTTGWIDTGADHAEGGAAGEFAFVEIVQVAAGVQLTWQSAGGATYRVYRGTDLANPASFADISGPVAGTTFTDTAPLAGAAFYRIEAEGGPAWQHHRFVIDMATQTFSMYLDDMATPVGTGMALSRVWAPVPCSIIMRHEGNSADDGYFLLDDVALTVTGSRDLSVAFNESFEGYPAAAALPDPGDFDPAGPWITSEGSSTGSASAVTPERVQVVTNAVVPARSGAKSLKIEGGQPAGVSVAWGTADKPDVEITWWARVPASVPGVEANYLRMSLYCAENDRTDQGDCALLGYGARSATVGDATSLTVYDGGWIDTGVDYTPDTWEKYKLVTHMDIGKYSIIKDPDGAAIPLADRRSMIGTVTKYTNAFIAAWSSSNGTGHPPVYIDDVQIRAITSDVEPPEDPYTALIDGGRFQHVTKVDIAALAGDAVVDPADNQTIYFLIDDVPASRGGVWRMGKTGPGEWTVDAAPLVGDLDRPSGLAMDGAGNLWWTHDYAGDVMRLKAPFGTAPPEIVIQQFQTEADDDPIALCVTPPGFSGTVGMPNWLAIADRGADDDAMNAVYLLDPMVALTEMLDYATFLVWPTLLDVGAANLNDIAPLPATNEVVTLSDDGFIFAIDAFGGIREIVPMTVFFQNAEALGVDPVDGRVWVADDNLDQIWSIDPATGEDRLEISFFMEGETRPDYNINFHDPNVCFSPDGSLLIVGDVDARNGGGRFFIFHNEE